MILRFYVVRIFWVLMHGSGQLSASLVSLLVVILIVFVCMFQFCITCFVPEIKLFYLIQRLG